MRLQYKEITVKKRLMCRDVKEGKYRLTFMAPSKSSKGKLIFNVAGEQSDFELPIISANVISSTNRTTIEKIVGNTVYINDIQKGENINLEIKVDFDSYCMMEVDYYANKK